MAHIHNERQSEAGRRRAPLPTASNYRKRSTQSRPSMMRAQPQGRRVTNITTVTNADARRLSIESRANLPNTRILTPIFNTQSSSLVEIGANIPRYQSSCADTAQQTKAASRRASMLKTLERQSSHHDSSSSSSSSNYSNTSSSETTRVDREHNTAMDAKAKTNAVQRNETRQATTTMELRPLHPSAENTTQPLVSSQRSLYREMMTPPPQQQQQLSDDERSILSTMHESVSHQIEAPPTPIMAQSPSRSPPKRTFGLRPSDAVLCDPPLPMTMVTSPQDDVNRVGTLFTGTHLTSTVFGHRRNSNGIYGVSPQCTLSHHTALPTTYEHTYQEYNAIENYPSKLPREGIITKITTTRTHHDGKISTTVTSPNAIDNNAYSTTTPGYPNNPYCSVYPAGHHYAYGGGAFPMTYHRRASGKSSSDLPIYGSSNIETSSHSTLGSSLETQEYPIHIVQTEYTEMGQYPSSFIGSPTTNASIPPLPPSCKTRKTFCCI